MAATSAVKGDQSPDSGPGGGQSNSMPLKAEGIHENAKSNALSEKQSTAVDSSKSLKEKNVKEEQTAKKFVDAPLPATNAWAKRSANLGSDTNQVQPQVSTKKEATANDQGHVQGNAVPSKPGKSAKSSTPNQDKPKGEKPKGEKAKGDSNGNKQTPADNNGKPKTKKFGEDYVEAPLPAVNPWKKSGGAAVVGASSKPFNAEQDPTPAAAVLTTTQRSKDVKPVARPSVPDPTKEAKPPENASNETIPNKAISPALADDNWPALHEVKVTETLNLLKQQ